MLTRAQRNNNPININAHDHWLGLMPRSSMTPDQAAETRFAVFQAPGYGFRAAGVLLLNYQRIYDLGTPRKWISRWAPPTENVTQNYIDRVCEENGWSADQAVDLRVPSNLAADLKAQSTVECGAWMFSEADLQIGVAMALNQH